MVEITAIGNLGSRIQEPPPRTTRLREDCFPPLSVRAEPSVGASCNLAELVILLDDDVKMA
jgi:hypothetical protein